MKKKLISFIVFIFISSAIYSNQYNWEKNYSDSSFTEQLENIVEETLDSTLIAYIEVDESVRKQITISIENFSFNTNNFNFEGKLILGDKDLPLSIKFFAKDNSSALEEFSKILYDTLRYDLSYLFANEEQCRLIYSNDINVIKFQDVNYNEGDLIYIKNYNNQQSLAIIDSIYDDYATIDYLFKPTSLINSSIFVGPKNEIDLGLSYDFNTNIIAGNFDYFITRALFNSYSNTSFGISFSYYNDVNDFSSEIASDLALKIELPLSKLIKKSIFLENGTLYSKTKIGLTYIDNFSLHSVLEVGYKQYLSSNFNISLALKNDSYKNSLYNVIVTCGVLF